MMIQSQAVGTTPAPSSSHPLHFNQAKSDEKFEEKVVNADVATAAVDNTPICSMTVCCSSTVRRKIAQMTRPR